MSNSLILISKSNKKPIKSKYTLKSTIDINDFSTQVDKHIKQSLGYMSPVEYRHSLGLAV